MKHRGSRRTTGTGFFAIGAAFLAIAWGTGQRAFLGVGFAFFALGIVFLGKSRRGDGA